MTAPRLSPRGRQDLVGWVCLAAGVLAFLLALLLCVPAPAHLLALLAVLLGEKTFLLAAFAALAFYGTWRASRSPPTTEEAAARRRRLIARAAAVALFVPTLGLCAWPVASAVRLARARQVPLALGRYLTARIDTGPAQPDGVTTFATVAGRPLELDYYRPEGQSAASEPAASVIVVHGGGWSKGDKGETALWSRWLARRGFAVFDIQYRLAPQPNWQTATGDVKCAIGWVKDRAQTVTKVILDPEQVALLGRSAGGHLALLAAYTATDPELPASCPVRDTRVSAVAAFYAPTDLVWGYGLPANRRVYDTSARLRDFLGGTPSSAPAAYHAAGIVTRVTAQAPRTLLVHGGQDQFVSPLHVDRLLPLLARAGVEHDTLFIPYGQHGFDHIFGGLSGQITETTLLRFLQQGMSALAAAGPPPRH